MMLMIALASLAATAAPNALPTPTSAAAESPAKAPLPAIATQLFALLAVPDGLEIDSFVKASFSPGAVEVEPTQTTLKRLHALARDSEGLDLTEFESQGSRIFFSGFTRKERIPIDGMLALRDGKILAFEVQKDVRARPPGAPAWPMKASNASEAVSVIAKELAWRASLEKFSGTVLIAHRGKPVLHQAFGVAERAPERPNRLDTLFATASTTKMLTSAAIAKLIEEKKLSFDTRVDEAVPALRGRPGADTTTIRDLLGHRVSYGEYFDEKKRDQKLAQTVRATDLLPLVASRPPERAPKGQVAYSNANYLVLAAAIESASGMLYSDYISKRVIRPVGMRHTTYGSTAGRPKYSAQGWTKDEVSDPLALGPWQSNDAFMKGGWRGGPAGGVWSTTRDMWQLVDSLAAGALISKVTLTQMLDDRVRMGPTLGSALGFMTRGGDKVSYFGHAGGGGNAGMSTAAFISPDREWAVVVLSNFSSPVGEMTAGQILDFLTKVPKEDQT